MEKQIFISVVLGHIIGTNKENVIEKKLLVSDTPQINSELYIEDVCYKVNRVVRTIRKVYSHTDNQDNKVYKDNKVEDTIYVFVTEYMVNVFQ